MASTSKDYFGLGRIVSLILAIIPFTAGICGIILCIQRSKWLYALIRIFFGWNILWIADLVTMILHEKVWILA